jgi:hypothetical protein
MQAAVTATEVTVTVPNRSSNPGGTASPIRAAKADSLVDTAGRLRIEQHDGIYLHLTDAEKARHAEKAQS